MAGQVDKDQVFLAAAFGQSLDAATEAGAGGQRAIRQVVAVVDQGDTAVGCEALVQQVADVVGFAHKYALLAIAGQGQGVEFDGWGRGG